MVVYDGVLDDECEAFRSVLSLVTGARFITVGAHDGAYVGPGGTQLVDRTFDQLAGVEVVVVPGGLGCERAADDPELRDFLHRMEKSARYVMASSTGTVLIASAGLLHGKPAATHWLASDLLRRYGSETDKRRLVITGNIITCEGRISALDAGFALVEQLEGSAAVMRIRAALLEAGQPLLAEPPWWERLLERLGVVKPERHTRPRTREAAPVAVTATATAIDPGADPVGHAEIGHDDASLASHASPVTPPSVMMELVEDEELVRRIRRNASRHR